MSPSQLRALLAATVLASLLLGGASSAQAQQLPDLPAETRIRVLVRGEDKEHTFVGKVERSDALSLRMVDERSGELRHIEWGRVDRLERSGGRVPFSFWERAGMAAGITAFGTLVGWASWHTCNDPQNDMIFSCIVMPERLSSWLRAGTWVGLTGGLLTALSMKGTERWLAVERPSGVAFTLTPSANGTALGLRIRF